MEKSFIREIVRRAVNLDPKLLDIDLFFDIEVVNEKYPLRLMAWLVSDDFNFMHDVYGIHKNLNRDTFELDNCFLPRFAGGELDILSCEDTKEICLAAVKHICDAKEVSDEIL